MGSVHPPLQKKALCNEIHPPPLRRKDIETVQVWNVPPQYVLPVWLATCQNSLNLKQQVKKMYESKFLPLNYISHKLFYSMLKSIQERTFIRCLNEEWCFPSKLILSTNLQNLIFKFIIINNQIIFSFVYFGFNL